MTPPAPPPPAAAPAATPYVPAWMLYVYHEQAFLTFNGRLVATATVTTPAQEARIEGVFDGLTDRLTHGHAARRAAPAARLALDRR